MARLETPRRCVSGEMLKAMGEIMMKYGKMTEGSPRQRVYSAELCVDRQRAGA